MKPMDDQTFAQFKASIGGNPQMKEALQGFLLRHRASVVEKMAAAPSHDAMLRSQGSAHDLRALANELDKW